jgi:hypothetical protein
MSEKALCPNCHGNGVVKIPGGVSECPACKGLCWLVRGRMSECQRDAKAIDNLRTYIEGRSESQREEDEMLAIFDALIAEMERLQTALQAAYDALPFHPLTREAREIIEKELK